MLTGTNGLFAKQLNFRDFYFRIEFHRQQLCKRELSEFTAEMVESTFAFAGINSRGACSETIFEMKLFAMQTNFNFR